MLPIYPAECQCAPLAMDVDVADSAGQRQRGQKGELVCYNPFLSQPLFFWGDDDQGSLYTKTYFSRFDRVWCHGDFATRTARGGFLIHGRSDATLNPGGVRIGSQDFYDVLHAEVGDAVQEALVVGYSAPNSLHERVVLFVVLRDEAIAPSSPAPFAVPDPLLRRINVAISHSLSPKHRPWRVVRLRDIPVNINGKKMEILAKRIINGAEVADGATASLRNPQAVAELLQWRRTVETERSSKTGRENAATPRSHTVARL